MIIKYFYIEHRANSGVSPGRPAIAYNLLGVVTLVAALSFNCRVACQRWQIRRMKVPTASGKYAGDRPVAVNAASPSAACA